MARKRAQKQKRIKRGRRLWLPALLLALLLALSAHMWAGARMVHLCAAEVCLPDLPAAFDGARVLFVSDLNLRGPASARRCAALMEELSSLAPDMLILGGDYARDADEAAQAFIASLAAFPVPLGKYAVLGEGDRAETLAAAFASADVRLLSDSCFAVERNGASLYLAGLSDARAGATPYTELGRYFNGDECVLVAAHNPASYVGVRVAEAREGGAWADLVLSGHNLGGQMRLFGRTLRTLPPEEARCLAGWYYEDGLPLLVSQGLACRDVFLRLGTRSEVWLLTLRRGRARPR